jgi:hypothetical protein
MKLTVSPDPGLALSGDLYSPKGHSTYVSVGAPVNQIEILMPKIRTTPSPDRPSGLVRSSGTSPPEASA